MRAVGTAVKEIINASPELQFGFYSGLFNLTQLARFIRPMVEARTFKEVQEGSLVMALSRLGKSEESSRSSSKARLKSISNPHQFEVDNVSVRSGLSALTLHRSSDAHRATQAIYTKLSRKDSYFTVSEGTSEITLIFESTEMQTVLSALSAGGQRPKLRREHLAALGVRFHPRYIEVPGLLQRILQQLALQGINIAELASTATELVIYIAEQDVRFGLDTLLRAFVDRTKEK